jgi:4-amino-4-deoxy-L-arabinose transferase-like glycosyltransferase
MVSPRLRIALPWIALLALGVRVAWVIANRHSPWAGDALQYWWQGWHLANGEGWHRVYEPDLPTAEYPPLHIILVAFTRLIGLEDFHDEQLFFAVVGTGTVVLVALLARAVTRSERVGVIAGVIAALYPMLWMPDGTLMAETTYGFFLVATLLAAVRYLRAPGVGRAVVFGGLLGLAALSRGEAVGLIVLLVAPLAWRRWRELAVVVAAFLVVLAPWEARLLTTFDKPVLISNNSAGIWVGSNCPPVYYGSLIGSWQFSCYGRVPPPGDESVRFAEYRHRGLEYMKDHASRLPLVVAARVGRLLDVYKPWDQGTYINYGEGRHMRATHLGLVFYWSLIPFAIVGVVLLRRRRERAVWVLLAPIALVVLVAIATYGSTRFRFAAEPSLVVLGAVSIDALWGALRARRRPASATATSVSPGMSQSQSIEV